MSHGQSSITRQQAEASVTGANNGVSMSGKNVVLGNDVGGSLAALLSNREIPMAGFSIAFTNIGKTVTGFPIFRHDATKVQTTPSFVVQNSASAELCRFNLPSTTEIYIGNLAGANITVVGNARAIAIGDRALNQTTAPFQVIAIGAQAMQNNTTGFQTVAVGTFALNGNTIGQGLSAFGHNALVSNTTANFQTGVGTNVIGKRTTGGNNAGFGAFALGETLVATNNSTGNSAFGTNCMQQFNFGNDNLCGGFQCLFTSAGGTRNVIWGPLCLNGGLTIGDNNCVLGSNLASAGGANTFTNNNIWIGANGIFSMVGLVNSTVIGTGITCGIANIVNLGRADQNTIVGATVTPADNGARLQIQGDMTTSGAAPLTLGASKMRFGKIVAAASVLNAAQYWEVVVDGVLIKVCIN